MFPLGVILGGFGRWAQRKLGKLLRGPTGLCADCVAHHHRQVSHNGRVDLCHNLNALQVGDFLRCVFLFQHPDI